MKGQTGEHQSSSLEFLGNRVQELESQLAEANMTIQSLIKGQVDALLNAEGNDMLLLRQTQQALQQANQQLEVSNRLLSDTQRELEQRVEQRTEDLEQAKFELEVELAERERTEAILQQINQRLRESEERFHVALKNSPILVYTTDLDLRYTWIHNPRHGMSASEVIGKRDDELLPAKNVAELLEFKRQVLSQQTGARKEIHIRVGGEIKTYDVTAEPLRQEDGEMIGLTVAAVEITEHRRLEQEMSRNAMRLEVQQRLIGQRESERMLIARDLHDGPLQDLIGATYILTDAMNIDEKEERLARMANACGTLNKLIRDLRIFCTELRPPTLAPYGLEKAIRSHQETFQEKYPDLHVELDLAPDGVGLPEDMRMALYRIYQEALNNVVRHSQAKNVQVRFVINPDKASLEIVDDGLGFHLPRNWVQYARQGHLGLAGIQERTDAIGGQLDIHSLPGSGTIVRVLVPRRLPA